jgi:TolB-like protein
MHRTIGPLTTLILCTALAGCVSSGTRYLHPNADLGSLKRVAVLPFENVSGAQAASDKVHKIFLVELLSMEIFEVVEPGQVSRAIRSENATSPDQLTPDDFKRIGKAMNADALFLGQVGDFQEVRSAAATAPEVTLQFRLVETTSGATVWSSSETRAGVKASTRLFGTRSESVTEATRKVIRKQLASLLE